MITDDVGNDFVIFSGMAADYKDYQFILNASTGEIIRVFKVDQGYSEVTKNTYMEIYMGKFYPTKWLVGSSQNKAFDFEWKGADADVSPYTMSNGDKLFKYAKDGKMYLFLFDYKTGTLKGSTSFVVSELALVIESKSVKTKIIDFILLFLIHKQFLSFYLLLQLEVLLLIFFERII